MHRATLLSSLALALATRIAAQGIDAEDIAPNCVSACSSIPPAADACERQYDDTPNEDQQELDCICNAQGMRTAIPECEACQRQYYGQDDDYDDIRTLLDACGFASVSATMTSMGAAPTGSTTVITSTYTETDRDDDDDDVDLEVTTITSVIPTGGAGAGATTATDAAGSAQSGVADAASTGTNAAGQITSQSGNLAPAMTAAPVLAAAGVAAAVFGL